MNENYLEPLNAWFADYCRGFYTASEADNRNYSLKEIHTHRVRDNMNLLSESLGLAPAERTIAQIIALFHDVGRFEQYRRFATFRDDLSVNHAALGVRVLYENRVLAGLPKEDRRTIFRAVALHNVFRLPLAGNGQDLLQVRLIRDADKLDIWRIFAEFYGQTEAERASAVGLGFPDTPGCSREALDCLARREMVRLSMLRNLNDFKLLQLSWVFDLNFPASFRLALDRNLIDGISATLLEDRDVVKVVGLVREYAVE
ncbi:MAG TPA: HD domain-containing protein, partial [Geobacteraceae bacterium]